MMQVLILSSVDWGSAWQRHQALAAAFAESGAEVFFVENTGFRGLKWRDLSRVLGKLGRLFSAPEPRREGRIVSPLVLPPIAGLCRRLNAAWFVPCLMKKLKRLGLRANPIVFAYLPTSTTLQILDLLRPSAVVYDCVDNFFGHPRPPKDLAETERELLRRAGLVLTTSPFLYESLRGKHSRVLELHHGVSKEFFFKPGSPREAYGKFCYFGTIWSALDYAPLIALAEAGFEVALIGPVKEEPPTLPASIRRLPPVPHEKLPEALAAYDALLLPYADTPYNQGVVPAKIYECLATGKPILASPLPGLKPLSELLYTADSPEAFVRAARGLPKTENPERITRRIAAAQDHAAARQFQRVAEEVSRLLSEGAGPAKA